jgi:hypothetical protein
MSIPTLSFFFICTLCFAFLFVPAFVMIVVLLRAVISKVILSFSSVCCFVRLPVMLICVPSVLLSSRRAPPLALTPSQPTAPQPLAAHTNSCTVAFDHVFAHKPHSVPRPQSAALQTHDFPTAPDLGAAHRRHSRHTVPVPAIRRTVRLPHFFLSYELQRTSAL